MIPVFEQLLILMIVVWSAAVVLRRIGLPTVMGELLMGVLVGPTVLGWVEPSEVIEVLAQMGVFFLMLHTGIGTEPREFFRALRVSVGVAIVGAAVPFAVSMGVALAFGLSPSAAVFVGLTMTATAVVVTLRILRDVRLQNTRMARVIIAACVIDDLFALIGFSLVLGLLEGGSIEPATIALTVGRVLLFFAVVSAAGVWIYPLFKGTLTSRDGKGLTLVLIFGLAFGLLAEALGLHILLGAYFAGLFFEEEIASAKQHQKVKDRIDGIAYSFLGPIFFISLGFHITLDAFTGSGIWFVLALTAACGIGQVLSAGGMARRLGFSTLESVTVGVGMCGRAEMAFVLASVGLTSGAFDERVFSILILTTFLLNVGTSIGLKICATKLTRVGP